MIKKASLIFISAIVLCVKGLAQSPDLKRVISLVEIRKVSPLISTGLAVNCDVFNLQFEDVISIDTIMPSKRLRQILDIVEKANDIDNKEIYVDTRAILNIHFENGESEQICFGDNFLSLNGVTKKIRKKKNYKKLKKLIWGL